MNPDDVQVEALADDALLLRLGDGIDQSLNDRVLALARMLRAEPSGWLLDAVPAYASLAVYFDPAAFEGDPFDTVAARLRRMLGAVAGAPGAAGRAIEIPVAYGGEFGPDLAAAADELGLDPAALAHGHAAGDYRVAMIGFAPGFPYLSGLDPALALPRLATPRTRVAAGSVGIGGAQTGIYPNAGPGGWRIIGRTPLRLFDPVREPPSLLLPGDRVRFVAIDADAFAAHPGSAA